MSSDPTGSEAAPLVGGNISASVSNVNSNQLIPPRITPRCVTGACHPANRRSMDWSESCGLVAYGSYGAIVVLDMVSLQVVQCLDNEHRSSVVKVAWTKTSCISKHLADRMTLASSETSGKILVWNVKSGEVKARLEDAEVTAGPVPFLAWMDGRIENTGHLLLALHPPYSIILWDTSSGTKVWKKSYDSAILGFDLDPFDANGLALRCSDSIILVRDFKPASKGGSPPNGQGRKLYLSGDASSFSDNLTATYLHGNQSPSPRGAAGSSSHGSSPGGNAADYQDFGVGSSDKGKVTRAKLKNMVKELVTGEGLSLGQDGTSALMDCIQVRNLWKMTD